MGNTYDAFISYQSSDLHFAERLFDLLRTEGFRVWFDKARLLPGYDWHREIEQGAEAVKAILAEGTQNAMNRFNRRVSPQDQEETEE